MLVPILQFLRRHTALPRKADTFKLFVSLQLVSQDLKDTILTRLLCPSKRMQGQREHRSAKASGPRKDWAAAPSTLSASVSRPNPSDRSVTPEPPVSIHSSMAEQQRETASPSSGWTVLEREGSSFVHAKRQALVSSAYVPEYEYPLSSVRQPSVAGPEEMLKPKVGISKLTVLEAYECSD